MYNEDFFLSLICKMYYIDKVKQNQIAEKFNVTPMQISRLLSLAEEKGIIQYTIKMPDEINLELSNLIKEKNNLQECFVVKNVSGLTGQNVVSSFLAKYVMQLLPADGIIGVSWGETIYQFANSLPTNSYPDCTVIQLFGGFYLEGRQSFTPTDVVMKIHQRLNSKFMLLLAPAYVGSKEIKKQLLEDNNNKKVLELAKKADVNILGISAFDKESTTYREGIIDDKDIEEIASKKAIGDMSGVFFDKDGKEIIWGKSEGCTGVPLSVIRKSKNPVCVASGSRKGEILKAIADKGFFKILVIDEELANTIV